MSINYGQNKFADALAKFSMDDTNSEVDLSTNLNITGKLTASGNITAANELYVNAKSQLANGASGALTKNTWYLAPADGNAMTVTLPTQANSTKGDTIVIEWIVGINDSQTQKVGTSGEFFAANSAIYKMTGATGSAVGLIMTVGTADGAADDFASFIGLTNAGPGIGSIAVFTYTGSAWRCDAKCTSSGTGVAANLSDFTTT